MLRKGYDPALIFDRKGNLIGFSTGSDACCEHECGSNKLQALLCSRFESLDSKIERHLGVIKRSEPIGNQIYVDSIYETKLIDNPDAILFSEFVEGGEKFAMMYCGVMLEVAKREIFPIRTVGHEMDCSGGWDSASFAFVVRGQKLITKLSRLYHSIQSKEAMFAGTFFEEKGSIHSGIVIVNRNSLRPENIQQLRKADLKAKQTLMTALESKLSADYPAC